eukprot:1156286-Pelagomonas_calceolata.AAC.5
MVDGSRIPNALRGVGLLPLIHAFLNSCPVLLFYSIASWHPAIVWCLGVPGKARGVSWTKFGPASRGACYEQARRLLLISSWLSLGIGATVNAVRKPVTKLFGIPKWDVKVSLKTIPYP